MPPLRSWHRGTCGTAQPGSAPRAAVASHDAHGKVLLFPNSYRILVFPLPSHPSAFSHGLRTLEPLAVLWKKETGKCTQTMEIPVFPSLLKHRGFQAYGKHPHQPKDTFCSIFLLWRCQVAPTASVAITSMPRMLWQVLVVWSSQGHEDKQ